MKRIDLHVHSTASDGIISPVRLVDLAIENNLCAMAITDHDTVAGLQDACEYSSRMGFKLITGIEFSIDFTGGTFHLVGLYIDYRNNELRNEIERLQRLRDSRALRIQQDLRNNGITIPFEEVQKEAAGGAIGKPHFGRILVRHGYAGNMDQVFERYMVEGKPGDVPRERISVQRGMELIIGAGGMPVLAHPVSLGFDEHSAYDSLIKEILPIGLQGIEAYASMHTREQVDYFLSLARKYQLLVTGGSDFHGDRSEEIGKWKHDELIPCSLLEDIESFRKRRCTI